MANANITIRVDADLKSQLQELVKDFGLDLTTFFTMVAKQTVREQAIPFKISREKPNKETIEAFNEVEEMKKNPKKIKSYSSFSELLQEIEKDV